MNKETMLLRQVNPKWVVEEGISSQTFRPTPKDESRLSVYNEEDFNAKESFDHFTAKGLPSSGVVGVTNEECTHQNLPCLKDDETFKGHALIDFTSFTKPEIERKAKILRNAALKRNWLYEKPITIEPEKNDLV